MTQFHQDVETILNNYRFQGKNINLISENIIKGFSIKDTVLTCVIDMEAQDQNFIKLITEDLFHNLTNIKSISDVKFVFTKEKQNKIKVPGAKKIVLISSAKGGVGKSTLTFLLAQYLQKLGYKIGILDADIYGPSLPTLTQIHTKPNLTNGVWSPHTWNNILVNSIGYLVNDDDSLIWRGPMISKSINQLMINTDWKDLDYLLIDMPPGTGDIHLSIATRFQIDGCFIIATPHDLSTSDTARTITMCKKLNIPICGIIQNMSFIIQDEGKKYLFGNGKKLHTLSETEGIPIITELPFFEENKIDDTYFKNILSFLP
jgi:ATP-binding protein involved in chromosome partitioning